MRECVRELCVCACVVCVSCVCELCVCVCVCADGGQEIQNMDVVGKGRQGGSREEKRRRKAFSLHKKSVSDRSCQLHFRNYNL